LPNNTAPPEIVAVVAVLIVDVDGGVAKKTILDTCGVAVLEIVFPDIRIPKPGILYHKIRKHKT
jgi:hypothetical protein